MEKKKVQIRGGFSDRYGIKPLNTEMQVDSLDNRTRSIVINEIYTIYDDNIDDLTLKCLFFNEIIKNVFFETNLLEIDRPYKYKFDVLFEQYIKEPILHNDYDDVLTMLEYLLELFVDFVSDRDKSIKKRIYKSFNELFEREYVGYRFVKNIIVPITDKVELQAINDCIKDIFEGCKKHINKALAYLSDRKKPDYNNSVKESISAVEAVCRIIVGKDKATLGDALKILERKEKLNGQLKSGFGKLYDYTNSADGIRHANGMFAENVTFEEAKFMLVMCCAFINYLKVKYANILSDKK